MTAIREVIIPIWRSSRPKYLVTFEVPASAARRLVRGAGRESDIDGAAAATPRGDVCLVGLVRVRVEVSLAAVGCVGPAWKF